MNATAIWNEVVFEARLKYLAFKRIVWLMETLLLFALGVLLMEFNVPNPYFTLLLAVQVARVVTEIANHNALSVVFQAPDRFIWIPFFAVLLLV